MSKSIAEAKVAAAVRRGRGRPPTTGIGLQIGVRWHAGDVAAIDAWRLRQSDLPERAEAIRRLTRAGLKAAGLTRKRPSGAEKS